jgi:ArsR family transcriptional regulator, arsenate/arsenite/antimonite-responsive transcriptional repressor
MEHEIAVIALGALAHENRLAVVRLLLEHAPEGLPAGAIGERLGLAPATLSFHLKELARTGLVTAQPDGRFIWYRTNPGAMNGLVAYLAENCCRAPAKAACRGPVTPKPRIVARTRLDPAATNVDGSCCAPATRKASASCGD